MRRRTLLFLALAVIVAVFAATRLLTHETPAGQPPLAYLDLTVLETLRADFNRFADRSRVIALLAPT